MWHKNIYKLFLDIQKDSQYHSQKKKSKIKLWNKFSTHEIIYQYEKKQVLSSNPTELHGNLASVSNFETANVFDPLIPPPRMYAQISQLYSGVCIKWPVSKTLRSHVACNNKRLQIT